MFNVIILYLLCISLLNCIKPHCRKYVTNTLNTQEFMLLNTFIIFISFLIYLIYSTSNNYIQLQQILNKYYNLTYLQFISAFTFSISTIITTFFIIKIDKNTTNPLINELMIKSITTIIVIFTSIYIFGESFTNYKLLGIIFLMLGLFLLS